ncbi:hypothetical protein WICPIJ_006111 [Wickerhamomyces pijperi]|uniref:Uncharacterized protein n=1 Tax=Wickerhamomyces pijperi TaxID=599730 RepID=A0A9P8TLB9_WICPI|nr:hypothetical protein WICPIJ_006111 [Wickerhamomyces pijperi]
MEPKNFLIPPNLPVTVVVLLVASTFLLLLAFKTGVDSFLTIALTSPSLTAPSSASSPLAAPMAALTLASSKGFPAPISAPSKAETSPI